MDKLKASWFRRRLTQKATTSWRRKGDVTQGCHTSHPRPLTYLVGILILIVLSYQSLALLHVKTQADNNHLLSPTRVKDSFVQQHSKGQDSAARSTLGLAKTPLPKKLFMLSMPEMTNQLTENYPAISKAFYGNGLNEDAAEIWLHGGFRNKTASLLDNDDPANAELILVPLYLKLHAHIQRLIRQNKLISKVKHLDSHEAIAETIVGRLAKIRNTTRQTIVLLTPCVSLQESEELGLKHIVNTLQAKFGTQAVYSVGFERNTAWQALPPSHIIVIPYVLRLSELHTEGVFRNHRHGIFYRGDLRPRALAWSGCNRSMLLPLQSYSQQAIASNPEGINVEIFDKYSRISENDYNHMVQHAEFCLAVCGDTVTSRSMASYMAGGCIPVRIGSRMRGHCETPCKTGWGWTHTKGLSHLPYPSQIDWDRFPEINEARFAEDPLQELRLMLTDVTPEKRQELRRIIQQTHRGFIYGWGNPVKPIAYGDAVDYIGHAIIDAVGGATQQAH